jgi:hypothetical protein
MLTRFSEMLTRKSSLAPRIAAALAKLASVSAGVSADEVAPARPRVEKGDRHAYVNALNCYWALGGDELRVQDLPPSAFQLAAEKNLDAAIADVRRLESKLEVTLACAWPQCLALTVLPCAGDGAMDSLL